MHLILNVLLVPLHNSYFNILRILNFLNKNILLTEALHGIV